MTKRAVVTGAAGFLGGWLCRYLKERGYWVRAVDYVEPRYGDVPCDEAMWDCDLRYYRNANAAVDGCDLVFALAADMGGMTYIGHKHFDIIVNNSLINVNTARAAVKQGVYRLLYTSSACIYGESMQMTDEVPLLAEQDAWSGKPQDAYGVEKLFSEELYTRMSGESDVQVRIARFHNIMGERGSWNDNRSKLPAAACRKVATAALTGNHDVEVIGDGTATRSFMHVDDCIEALYRLMGSGYDEPVNIGTDRAASVNEVFEIVADIAGIDINLVHIDGPVGVQSRNADLTLQRSILGFEPKISLEDGLSRVYHWVLDQAQESAKVFDRV